MSLWSLTFRDFGLLPENLTPPRGPVRAFFSGGRVFGQYLFTAIVATIGIVLAAAIAWALAFPLNLLGATATLLTFAAVLYLATHNDFRWVELDGDIIRARRLYAAHIVERRIEEIDSLSTMVLRLRRHETVVIERLLGRVKGIEIRFTDRRTPIRVLRADPAMTHAQELIEGVLYRMSLRGELNPEIVNFAGQPLVKSIHYKGRQPRPAPRQDAKVLLICAAILGVLFGGLMGMMGTTEAERQRLGSVPPQEITVQALAEHGPGENRHVTLTNFRPGGYAIEEQNSTWTQVWVALFPANQPPLASAPRPIQVVLSSTKVRSESDLRRLLQSGRVTGICPKSPTTGWGGELGPNLRKSNANAELTSAWVVEEMETPPTQAHVSQLLAISAACFAVALMAALVIFFRR